MIVTHLSDMPSTEYMTLDTGVYLDTGIGGGSDIFLREGSDIRIFLYISKDIVPVPRVFHISSRTNLDIRGVIIGSDISQYLSLVIDGQMSRATVDVLALALPGAQLTLEHRAQVLAGSEQIYTRVDQTHILLGASARITGVPILEIQTDTIEGGHSCRIHRIAGDKLIYLQSHGLDAPQAEGLLIQGEIWSRLHLLDGYEGQSLLCSSLFEKIKTDRKNTITDQKGNLL